MHDDLTAIGKKTEEMSVVIQPQANVKHAFYMAVYEAALKAGFTQISFTTLQ